MPLYSSPGDDAPPPPVCPKFQPNVFDPSRCHDCLRQKHLHSGGGGAAAAVKHLLSGGAGAAAAASTEGVPVVGPKRPQSPATTTTPTTTNSATGSGIATGNGIGIGRLPHRGGGATGNGIGIGRLPHRGGGAPSQQAVPPSKTNKGEGKDASSKKEDSDGAVSVVSSSYCDVIRGGGGGGGGGAAPRCGGGAGRETVSSSLDCDLYYLSEDDDDSDIDDEEDSTDSGRDQSDYYPELCSSASADDDYLPLTRRHSSTHPSMTRLDPPPHRPNPHVWMEEARSKDRFGRHSGSSEERGSRESGYFSLGKAGGARSVRDQSPGGPGGARSVRDQSPGGGPTAFRHYERGHALYSTRNIEPKDIIPFRTQGLGVASERQPPEFLNDDAEDEILPPDPYEVAIEVEAQVGPRSPSPTPFKIAESLASGRRGRGSSNTSVAYGRGNLSSNAQPSQGRFDSSRHGSALQSRASSPPQGNVAFRRSESAVSLNNNRRNFDGGGGGRTQGGGGGSLSQRLGRGVESETLPRNFRSITDLSSSLQVNGSLTGRGGHRRSSSPPKRDYNSGSASAAGRTSNLRKAESRSSLLSGRGGGGRDSRPSSPPRRDYSSTGQTSLRKAESSSSLFLNGRGGGGRDSRPSSPPRRTCEARNSSPSSPSARRSYNNPPPVGRSVLRKAESSTSLNGRGHHQGRCGSPIREGYDMESQAKMRNPELWNSDQEPETLGGSSSFSPARRDYGAATSQMALRKTQSSGGGGGRGCDSRSSSPGRRDARAGLQSRNCSPSRKGYDASPPSGGQSLLRKAETNGGSAWSYTSHHGSSPTGRRGASPPPGRGYEGLCTSGSAFNSPSRAPSRAPSRPPINHPPGYSILRTATGGESARSSSQRNSTSYGDKRSDSSNHAPRSNPSSPPPPSRVRESNRNSSSSRAASPSRHAPDRTASPSRHAPDRTAFSRSSSGNRAGGGGGGRRSPETRCSSPTRPPPSLRIRSPSPSPQSETMRRHSSSQSSLESSESGIGSGRNREEYAAMADLPKATWGYVGQTQSNGPKLFKPASHSVCKQPSWEEPPGDEWPYGGSGRMSRAQSSTSLHNMQVVK